MKHEDLEKLVDWWISEEDVVLWFGKGFLVVTGMILGVMSLPIWIIPYIVYKNFAK